MEESTQPVPLSKARIRELKARAQRLKARMKLGRQGLTPQFVQSLNEALKGELLKVKFDEFRDQKHELAQSMAQQTASHLITIVGNVAVFYREKSQLPG